MNKTATNVLPKGENENEIVVPVFLRALGRRVRDKVTGFTGVISSVSFDLYGCVQCVVTPPVNKDDSKLPDSVWFDVQRLQSINADNGDPLPPVMRTPYFIYEEPAEGASHEDHSNGPAPKPARRHP